MTYRCKNDGVSIRYELQVRCVDRPLCVSARYSYVTELQVGPENNLINKHIVMQDM